MLASVDYRDRQVKIAKHVVHIKHKVLEDSAWGKSKD